VVLPESRIQLRMKNDEEAVLDVVISNNPIWLVFRANLNIWRIKQNHEIEQIDQKS
jgi:hypothetical protein